MADWNRQALARALATVAASIALNDCALTDNYYVASETNGAGGGSSGASGEGHDAQDASGDSAQSGTRTSGTGQGGTGTGTGGAGGAAHGGSHAGGSVNDAGAADTGQGGAETGGAGGAAHGGSHAGGSVNDAGAAGTGQGGAETGGAKGTGGTGSTSVNLISNSGFEDDVAGWSVLGGGPSTTIVSSANEAHSGTRSLLIAGRTKGYHAPVYRLIGMATPGSSYRSQVWVRLASGAGTADDFWVTVRVTCSDASTQYVAMVEATSVSSEFWTELAGENVVPECTTGTPSAIDFYVEGPATVASFYMDDVVFELLAP